MNIRSAAYKDIEHIYAVEQSAFPIHRQANKETFINRLNLFPKGFLVAEEDDQIAGISTALIVERFDSIKQYDKPDQELHDTNREVYYLRSLAINQEFQKQGLGKALVQAQISNAKDLNKKIIRFTASEDVAGFYKKLDFKRITDYLVFHNSKQAIWEKYT